MCSMHTGQVKSNVVWVSTKQFSSGFWSTAHCLGPADACRTWNYGWDVPVTSAETLKSSAKHKTKQKTGDSIIRAIPAVTAVAGHPIAAKTAGELCFPDGRSRLWWRS